MKVFKFGGASVKSAKAVRNLGEVMKEYNSEEIVVVISAMGKMTNALERVTRAYFFGEGNALEELKLVKDFHYQILEELFPDQSHPVYTEINNTFVEIEWAIEDEPTGSYDFEYDQIVSIGEMLSTKIVSAWMNDEGIYNKWFDVRDFLRTDNTYREGRVDWEITQENIDHTLLKFFKKDDPKRRIAITQGFIGVTSENYTTTLGREGSDYTAAIIAYLANAEEVTIWKDVPGVLNADPKFFEETKKLNHISYLEAIELAYYGASVIHPKTIKPLQNKQIPLFVRSFINFREKGTVINHKTTSDSLIPSFIFKRDQVLISMSAKDFSFIMEENLSDIYRHFAKLGVRINLMQNSAVSFSVSVDNDHERVPALLNILKREYKIRYNDKLDLLTIRHYDQTTIDALTSGREILLEQKSRHTAQMIMR